MNKYFCVEEYIDIMCPNGENDKTVRAVHVNANSEKEAIEAYKRQYTVDCNNKVTATLAGSF